MKKAMFKSYDELPLMLSVPEMAAALGISRAGAYELVRTEGFPALKIGSRIVIPKDKLREWVNESINTKSTRSDVTSIQKTVNKLQRPNDRAL